MGGKNKVEVEISVIDKTKKALGKASASLEKYRDQLKTTAIVSGSAFAAFSGAIYKATQAASDLEETASKYGVVFRGVEQVAGVTLGKLTDDYGFARQSAMAWLSSIQDTLVPMGVARNKAAELSGEIVKLSIDIGSFNNQPTADVMRDIQSALVGNHETVRKYGIVITEAALKQEALNSGLSKNFDQLSASEKMMLRYKLIVSGSSDAVGDFERTQDSFANQSRIVSEQMKELFTRIGKLVLPTVKELTMKVREVVEGVVDWVGENPGLVEGILKWGTVISGVVFALSTLGLALPAIIAGIATLLGPIGLVVAAFAALTAAVVYFWDDIKFVGQVMGELWGRAYDDFKDRFAEPLTAAWDWIIEAIKKAIGFLVDVFVGGIEIYFKYFVQPIIDGVGKIYDGFRWVMDKMGMELPELTESGGLFHSIASEAQQAWNRVGDAIETVRAKNKQLQEESVAAAPGAPALGMPAPGGGLTQDQLTQYEDMQKKLNEMHAKAEADRTAATIAAIDQRIQRNIDGGLVEFEQTRDLIFQKAELEIQAKRDALDAKLAMEEEAFQNELDKFPEQSEQRAELLEEWYSYRKEQEDLFQEYVKGKSLEVTDEIEKTRIDSEESVKKRRGESIKGWKTDLKQVGKRINEDVTGGLKNAIIHGESLGSTFKSVGNMILEFIVDAIAQAIIKAIALKTILSTISFGLFAHGGVVGAMASGGIIRAQSGLLVPNHPGSYRIGSDSVPILATPGEAILPVWLTQALKAVLGSGGQTGRMNFQAGGEVAPAASGPTIIIQGPIYANDQKHVMDLMDKISDLVLYQRVPLHATTAGELRS